MIRRLLAAAAFMVAPLTAAHAQVEQQSVVDRATLTVQDLMPEARSSNPQGALQNARAVMICPQVFRAAFIFGGSGGDCVLVARDGAGSWSYPAFYGIGSGSAGLQAGIQDSEIMMFILTPKGLGAVMDSQFKFGADAGIAVASLGAGVEGATTTDLGADIVIAAKSRGLFAGISLQGSVMTTRTAWNRAYYGRDLAARSIVMDMAVSNPGADPLREVLTRFGGKGPVLGAAQPQMARAQQPAQAPITSGPVAQAPVQQQSLPPPRR
jgi:lipid-binding SYLF domain-containing protein